MKNIFEEPNIEVVKFLSLDVIACSSFGEDSATGNESGEEDTEPLEQ